MEPTEWSLWTEANRRVGLGSGRISRPCEECPLAFALEMRAVGRCNGEPDGAPEDEEDEPMDVSRVKGQPVTVTVSAPCGTCLHRQVCAIKADVEAASEADVALPLLSPALKPALSIELECGFYAKERGLTARKDGQPKKGREWTPEQRQAAAARLAAGRAAKAGVPA